MRKLLTAVLAATLATGVAAQSKLYQVRMPDGRILFTDQPPPGATIIGETRDAGADAGRARAGPACRCQGPRSQRRREAAHAGRPARQGHGRPECGREGTGAGEAGPRAGPCAGRRRPDRHRQGRQPPQPRLPRSRVEAPRKRSPRPRTRSPRRAKR
ncbi:MAG: hypothetical protein MZW92_04735 [Comamonadaceae bacterium]|nr:hypothetical protein [Comamonadaceae bacterium]